MTSTTTTATDPAGEDFTSGEGLRALLSGLVLAVTAQATLAGSLAPLRSEIAGWWTVEGGSARNLRRVGEHNHQDVVTLAQLFLRLVQAEADERASSLAP